LAVTKGHGNPNWSREEIVLALDLYNRFGRRIPSESHVEVIKLSNLLRNFPYHAIARRNPTFRNPAGVSFKLQNLHSVITGKGLKNASKLDRLVVDEFADKTAVVTDLAKRISSGIEQFDEGSITSQEELEEEFHEGRMIFTLHKNRERSKSLRKNLLKKNSKLCCEICNFSREELSRELQESLFEAHHIIPLSAAEVSKTRVADMALLCACCHRAIHKLISLNKRWIGIAEAIELLEY